MNFAAIDVETANSDVSSICQIGIACYQDGLIAEEWKSYIDPEDFFDPINVAIHGIDAMTVAGSPKLPDVSDQLHRFLDNQISVCHTHFDRVAIHQAVEKYRIRSPNCTWLDSARVVRRAWTEFAWRGYGLKSVCDYLGYEFNHHDALEDAKAAGRILLAASDRTGLDLQGWLKRIEQPIDPSTSKPIGREGDPEGPLFGEVLAFTGALEIPRHEAADMAANIGCQVASGVTKKTTILVVGDQDARKLAGHDKSSKHKKAEDLISKGFSIRILRESDFKELVALAT